MDKVEKNSQLLEDLASSMSKEEVVNVAGPMMQSVMQTMQVKYAKQKVWGKKLCLFYMHA